MNQVKAKTNKKVVTLIKPKASTKTSVNMTKVTSEKKLKSKNKQKSNQDSDAQQNNTHTEYQNIGKESPFLPQKDYLDKQKVMMSPQATKSMSINFKDDLTSKLAQSENKDFPKSYKERPAFLSARDPADEGTPILSPKFVIEQQKMAFNRKKSNPDHTPK